VLAPLQPFSQLGTLLGLEVEARGGVPLGKSFWPEYSGRRHTNDLRAKPWVQKGDHLARSLLCQLGSANTARGDVISVTNLVTDDQAVNSAQITDPFLKNAWGISHSTGSPFWVSDNAAGVATLYSVNPTTNVTTKVIVGSPPDPSGGVVIPPVGSGTPTGQVFNEPKDGSFKVEDERGRFDPNLSPGEDPTLLRLLEEPPAPFHAGVFVQNNAPRRQPIASAYAVGLTDPCEHGGVRSLLARALCRCPSPELPRRLQPSRPRAGPHDRGGAMLALDAVFSATGRAEVALMVRDGGIPAVHAQED